MEQAIERPTTDTHEQDEGKLDADPEKCFDEARSEICGDSVDALVDPKTVLKEGHQPHAHHAGNKRRDHLPADLWIEGDHQVNTDKDDVREQPAPSAPLGALLSGRISTSPST